MSPRRDTVEDSPFTAGDRSMRAGGRNRWNAADTAAARKVLDRLMKRPPPRKRVRS
jgi:hypothetical protein